MKARKKEAVELQEEDKRLLSFFDVDARSELRAVPFSTVQFPPRVGEQIELRADIEHGGGIYVVVGVRHILVDDGSTASPSTSVTGMVVDVKPQHAAELNTSRAAMELNLEEIVSVSAISLPELDEK